MLNSVVSAAKMSPDCFGKVPKGHPFQHISQFHPLLCRPFRSDALLKPVFPIGEEKPQQDQNDDAR